MARPFKVLNKNAGLPDGVPVRLEHPRMSPSTCGQEIKNVVHICSDPFSKNSIIFYVYDNFQGCPEKRVHVSLG